MNRYYSTLRPIAPGTIPSGIRIDVLVNFDRRTFVDEIGKEAWGYFDTPTELTKQTVANYDLLPVGGIPFRTFSALFHGVLEQKDIDRLDRFALYGYKKAHHIMNPSELERSLARSELVNHLFGMVDDADCIENLIHFCEATKIKADPYALGERIIDSKLSNMVD